MRVGLLILLAALAMTQSAQESPHEQAAKWFQQGRAAEAETALKALIAKNPADVRALMLLGVILDSAQRFGEAEAFYNRALELAPRSVPLLYNLGNHFLTAGNPKRAESLYRKAVALDGRHPGANLHLAEMRVADKNGLAALGHLDQMPQSAQQEPVAQLLRGQALALSNRCTESGAVLGRLRPSVAGDSSFSFSIGLAYAACKRYSDAEASFSRALETDPANFDVLYNLGLVARHANHLERARQVFEIAVKQRPDDPDALYGLAEVLARTGEGLEAATLLYRLHGQVPERAAVALLLARTTEQLGYFDEASRSYHDYLKLQPKDELARREWGFSLARTGNAKEALPPLAAFAEAHPKDARGQYELAIAEALIDQQKALRSLDRALALDPALGPARYARAVLHFQEDEFAPAMTDFQTLRERDPENAQLLDWVGQILLRTGKMPEAAEVLKRAVERAPQDRAVLMHYSTALRELNRDEERAAVLATFQRVATSRDVKRRQLRGLFEFLDLSPAEQQAKYRSFLEKAAAVNPSDQILRTRWGTELLEQGRSEEAAGVFRSILALTPDETVLRQCGGTLLRFEQYALAAEFLKSVPGARLDLATAVFRSAGPQSGLSELDKTPVVERQGDYYLLRAQILEALGREEEATDSLNRGIRAAPTHADMYLQAAVFLNNHNRHEAAAQLLADATRLLPDASELWLARAITLELLERTDEALKVLAQIESRWPEWYQPYLIHGIALETAKKPEQAKQMLDTAIALGAREAYAYFYLARAIYKATPEKLEEARKTILQAVAMDPDEPNARWLAGRILIDRKEYATAVEHLNVAVRLAPQWVPAHYLLVSAYHELGDEQKAQAESKLIEDLTEPNRKPESSSPLERLLLGVKPPA
jgi:tetratricopeptide (TPR) repeat protein